MENNNKPLLYSKTAIIAFSLITSFAAGYLYVANLKTLRKDKYTVGMTLYSVLASVVLINALKYAGVPLIYSYLPVNLVCGVLLTNVFWNSQIEVTEYNSRSIIYPLIITVSIILCFFTISYFTIQRKRPRSVIKHMNFIPVTTVFY